MAASLAAPLDKKSWLDKVLSLAADVQPGEAITALLLAVDGFLLLAAYYTIRPVREALLLPASLTLPGGALIRGPEIKAYTGAIFAGLFIFIVPAYSAFAGRVNRIRLMNWVTLFFASNLVIFFLLGQAGVQLGIPFFVWIGIFNLMVMAQFWSFANDVYTPEQGKRLFAIVGFGGSVGAIAGSTLVGAIIKPLGEYVPMLVAGAILAACLVLTNIIHAREKGRAGQAAAAHKQAEQPLSGEGGFRLVLSDRYLLLIALVTLMAQFVNTNGNYILGRAVAEAARQGAGGGLSQGQIVGSIYANVDLWQNLLAVFIQFFLVSRIFKHLGVGRALFILPVIALFGYGMLVALPVLSLIRLAKILENATDYSLQNTARRALFLPTSREAKYKALQAVETFFWRGGDMLSAVATFVVAGWLGLGVREFAAVNLALGLVWIVFAAGAARQNSKLMAHRPAEAA